jgi:3-hydroxybutyryl-CoA dehydratase
VPEATEEFKWRLREAFDEMHVEQTFSFRRTFTGGDMALFCGVTGDYNPYHQDESFAKESWYGSLTIPGLLTGRMLTHVGGSFGLSSHGDVLRVPGAGLRQRHYNLHRHHRREERGES